MSDLIDFRVIRLREELKKFRTHNAIPSSFITGVFTAEDIEKRRDLLTDEENEIADELLDKYKKQVSVSYNSLHYSLVKEYRSFMNTCCTSGSQWMFPGILAKYRKNINPVRSLYYEMRSIMFSYDPNNQYHAWLYDTLSDTEFLYRLIECTWKDKRKLDHMLDYYHPLFKATDREPPVELLHMLQTRQDMVEYVNLFNQFKNWHPDE